MWYALPLFLGDLVGYDRQTFVQLHGITVDHFAIVTLRQRDGQLTVVVS